MAGVATKTYKYIRIIEVDKLTGKPTGKSKINNPNDKDYIPPVLKIVT